MIYWNRCTIHVFVVCTAICISQPSVFPCFCSQTKRCFTPQQEEVHVRVSKLWLVKNNYKSMIRCIPVHLHVRTVESGFLNPQLLLVFALNQKKFCSPQSNRVFLPLFSFLTIYVSLRCLKFHCIRVRITYLIRKEEFVWKIRL